MDDEGDSSEGEGGRVAVIQRQVKRRMLNMRHIPHESVDTTATLPEYTSSPPPESSSGTEVMSPPKYPKLTAEEEADEERDAVGDVVRRVRVRRRRSMSTSNSGSDPYLDSLLARSVHALELSNALLQSSMTTQSSLSALFSHDVDRTLDRSIDSHARFLASQIHASDARRAWIDDITRQVDSLECEHPPPSPAGSALGLSQSLPDSPDGFMNRMRAAGIGVNLQVPVPPSRRSGGLQHGERPRSPPPRCMTQYITAEANTPDGAESILLPSTNGLRSGPRVHSFASRSRQSSGEYGEFARQQQVRGSGTSTPVSSLHSPRRTLSVSAQHSPHASVAGGVYQHGNLSSPQVLQHQSQYTSHQIHTPVRPVLSAVPAEPSTPAYNMLSAIALRSPTPDGGASGAPARFINELGPRFINDLGPHAEVSRGYGRGRGGSGTFVTVGSGPVVGAGVGGGSGLRRSRSATPSTRGGFVNSPIISPSSKMRGNSTTTSTTMSSPSRPNAQIMPAGTISPARSKPSSRTASSGSVPSVANPTTSAPGPSQASPSSKLVVRHPFLQPDPHRRQNQPQSQSQSQAEAEAEQKYKSAGVLRRILDASKPQHDEPEEVEEERGRSKGKQPAKSRARLPTWSVIPPTGTTVKVETVTPGGLLSIEGISAAAPVPVGTKSAIEPKSYHDPLELPGEHPRPTAVSVPRSRSAGPSNRLGTLFSAASLPRIPTFGNREPEPPPPLGNQESDNTVTNVREGRKDKGKERERPRLEIDTEALEGLPNMREENVDESIEGLPKRNSLRVQLNGLTIDTDAGPSESRLSETSDSDSENGSSLPSQVSLPLPPRLFDQPSRRPSSLRLAGSPRPSLKQPGSGASTPRSVTFSPLPPKHVSSGSRPLSEAKAVRRRKTEKEKEKPGWFASWFGPLPSPSGSSVKSGSFSHTRRGWDSPRSMDDWQM
ncbi:hypothetical protein RhiJN_15281 [Ceratobasidium sp. AG-Ba]|nr:hypothetical protein RhiJN_15281 [Ceratobasidium sp. AG-Ba]